MPDGPGLWNTLKFCAVPVACVVLLYAVLTPLERWQARRKLRAIRRLM